MRKENNKNGHNNSEQLDIIYEKFPKHRFNTRRRTITSEKWVEQIFNTKTAKEGGVARRKLSSIDKFASQAWVLDEATKRGFYVIQVKQQWVFICNERKLHIVEPTALAA